MGGRRKVEPNAQSRAPAVNPEGGWLLLIHQIPPKPAYLRVKIWRRLQRLGAVPLKNSVYVLPANDQTLEDFQWVRREIVADGGDVTICTARLIDGLTDDQARALFVAARQADYNLLVEDTRKLASGLSRDGAPAPETINALESQVIRLKRRIGEIEAIDFFAAPGHNVAEVEIAALERRLRPVARPTLLAGDRTSALPRGAIWVTRADIHVDRIASAWLIHRFIDSAARFKFVTGKAYRPAPGEQRFDMFEAEFTHEGDRCTFEVLLLRAGLDESALRTIGEIVHDLDLKDEKFAHPETAGLERLLGGIALAHTSDEARLARGSAMFDDLYEVFRRRPPDGRSVRPVR